MVIEITLKTRGPEGEKGKIRKVRETEKSEHIYISK